MTICFSKYYEKNLPFLAENELFWGIISRNAAVMSSNGYFLNAALLLFIKKLDINTKVMERFDSYTFSMPLLNIEHSALYKRIYSSKIK